MAAAPGRATRALGEARAEARSPGEGGRLVIWNTFFHYEEEAERGRIERLFRCRSAPAPLWAQRPGRTCPGPAAGAEARHAQPRVAATLGAGPPGAVEWRTTVLLRNVPYLLSRGMLVELLDSQGLKGQYDLVYMPRDFNRAQTLGYAVVNAVDPQIALRLFRVLNGFQSWPLKCRRKVCAVDWCHRQGLQSNLGFLRNSSIMHESVPEDFKPMFFLQGNQVPFPASTKRLRNWKRLRHRAGR
ncbi:unnamed protein product [Prorocentrum cordatum]|uniref:Mei2-like C-terminal RNA recognition motif domain-containing protein n=1 Tax=Prorocentrum cordatum TaxID=2364126 RepID=A0ABN9UGN5_9DINO|nr:unnamed protein product [Polarella glacialis]